MAARKKKSTPVTEAQLTTALGTQAPMLIIQPPSQEQISLALSEAQAAVAQLQSEAQSLTITDHLSYSQADSLLKRVMDGEKVTESKFRPIITPLREPLDWIYETKRGVDRPLGDVKVLIKRKMGEYQLQEKRRLDAEREENERKAREAQVEWLRLNPPSTITLPSQPAMVQVPTQPVITFLAPPSTPAPTASHSSTRFERRVRTTDLDLLVDACLSGGAPTDLLTIRPSILQEYFDKDPGMVGSWPGVEVYDHPIITGRS